MLAIAESVSSNWRRSDFINRALLNQALDCRARTIGGPYLALIQIALDESGKLDNTRDVVFGGCALENEESKHFGRAWLKRIDKAGIFSIHMKNVMWSEGEFKGREDERDRLLVELAQIARESNPLLIASPIKNSAFRSFPKVDQERLKNPVYCGFEACVRGAVDSIQEPLAHSLQIICDISEEYAVSTLRLFNTLRQRDPEVNRCCHGITFADDNYVPALQLADMFAYSCREYQSGSPRKVILDIIESLTGSRSLKKSTGITYVAGNAELGSGTLNA